MSARRIVLLGPPGVGKGTQAKRLSLEWKVPVIVTGDLFREAMAREDALGQKVAGYVRQGELVPDEVVVEVIRERLKR
ncbi:MAG: nucleoside monophosphate kinase, partial [Fimbriimonadales bacterium]|nr:nucleoside monophosphate kinase [Fimbriimonadales bacterium]